MEFLVIGLVTAINLIVIKKKVDKKRYQDAALDATLFILVVMLFAGSYAGMVVAMIASMVVSIYLYANPPTYFTTPSHKDAITPARIWQEIKHFDPSKDPRRPYDDS